MQQQQAAATTEQQAACRASEMMCESDVVPDLNKSLVLLLSMAH